MIYMKSIKILLVLALQLILINNESRAQEKTNNISNLNAKQKSIVSISALTAKGDLPQLTIALNEGLDSGLTVNEIKEVLVHLSAYAGFPRSLQGINTLMAVIETRKGKGINDKFGKDATPKKNNESKYEQGKKNLEALTGQPDRVPKTGYAAFVPIIDTFLKEHLFADIFNRDVLTYIEREIVTISALVSMGGVEPMMRSHMNIGLRLGLSTSSIQEILGMIEQKIGKQEADSGRKILDSITGVSNSQPVEERLQNSNSEKGNSSLYSKGVKAPSNNFTGTAWVNMVVLASDGLDCSTGVVTFEPGARTAWHRHPGGQILLITEGKGYYQERGKSIQIMQKGDVIKCIPGTEHWHGASPDSKVTHIAIGPNSKMGSAVWLEKVTEKEYGSYKP